MIKRFWTQLDPNKKRWVSIAGGVFVLFAVVTMFSGEPKKEEKRGRQETIKHVLTDKNTREIGIDSLSADVKMVSREKLRPEKGAGTSQERAGGNQKPLPGNPVMLAVR